MMLIRTTDDLDTIAAMDRECFGDDAYPVDLVGYDPECWLATTADGHPAAFAVAVTIDGVAYLRRAGVLPEYRGQGLQTRLIRTRVRWANQLRCSRVETYTMPYAVESMRSLINCKFRPHRPTWDYANSGVVYWKRELSVPC